MVIHVVIGHCILLRMISNVHCTSLACSLAVWLINPVLSCPVLPFFIPLPLLRPCCVLTCGAALCWRSVRVDLTITTFTVGMPLLTAHSSPSLCQYQRGRGCMQVKVVRLYVGSFFTSLDMQGASISLLPVDSARLAKLDSPTQARFHTECGSYWRGCLPLVLYYAINTPREASACSLPLQPPPPPSPILPSFSSGCPVPIPPSQFSAHAPALPYAADHPGPDSVKSFAGGGMHVHVVSFT